VIELYAITDHPTAPLPVVAGLRAVPADGLAAVCGPAADVRVSPEALWRHEEVVEALMADRDLLPVRYGSRLADETAVARAVEERHDEFEVALSRVRGAVELSVRVVSPGGFEGCGDQQEEAAPRAAPDAIGDGEGIRYLRAHARARAAREAVVATIDGPLSALARATVRSRPRTASELLCVAYLVDRGRVDAFTRAVTRLQGARPELRLLCTGPWPPYSFVER
jgi:hypothetical protein